MKDLKKLLLIGIITIIGVLPIIGAADTASKIGTTIIYDRTDITKHEVEFKHDLHGKLTGTSLLYIQDGFSIDKNEVPNPIANKGYIFDKWINETNNPNTEVLDWSSEIINHNTVYLALFKKNCTSLNVKNIILQKGTSWKPEDNFISATDVDGNLISFEHIKVSGVERVDLNKLGIYPLTYEYAGIKKTVTLTITAAPLKEYQVEFKATEGGSLIGTTKLKVREGMKVSSIPKMHAKTGYNFEAWYMGSVKVDPRKVNITKNTVFTANFKEQKIVMYRLYNPNSGEHFYTASVYERDSLKRIGWRYEGIGWNAPANGNGTPVYRLYNANAGDHHYTLNSYERDSLIKTGWKYEGIGWYSKGKIPLYRQYNPNASAGSHNYTTSKTENDSLVKLGWKYEGIGWYALNK